MNDGQRAWALRLDDLLRRAAAAQRLRLERVLRPFALSSAQFLCIQELRKRPRQSNAELARACALSPQTMIVVVANLEKRELVKRIPDEENIRILRLCLTRKGEELASVSQASAGVMIAAPFRIAMPEAESRAIASFLEQVGSFGE